MKKRRVFVLLVIGLFLLVTGIWGAVIFYNFPMGIFSQTVWRDVVIFSGIAVLGFGLFTWALVDLVSAWRRAEVPGR